jgi:hypothetical protein
MARSYRFDQISSTYSDRKIMKSLADAGKGTLIQNAPSEAHPPIPESEGPPSPYDPPPITGPLLIYVWRSDYNQIVSANQHHGLNFVVFDPPTDDEWAAYGLTDEEWRKYQNQFNGIHDDDDKE